MQDLLVTTFLSSLFSPALSLRNLSLKNNLLVQVTLSSISPLSHGVLYHYNRKVTNTVIFLPLFVSTVLLLPQIKS